MNRGAHQQSMTIGIVADDISPRLVYTVSMVFKRFLGIRFELISTDDWNTGEWKLPCIAYSKAKIEGLPSIFACGLLSETHIRLKSEQLNWTSPSEQFLFDRDILASFFYHLSQYQIYQKGLKTGLDEHGRHPDLEVGYALHEDLRRLENEMVRIFPSFQVKREFDYEITIDVDHPWKHRHKPVLVKWGGLLKSIFKPNEFKERWAAIFDKKDPYDVLSEVKRLCPADKTKVFFLVGGSHSNDSRFNIEMPEYKRLVKNWQSAGFEIGLHPSYETFKNAELLRQQKTDLLTVIGQVNISRQHYLRYATPTTFRNLLEAGIQREYSICPKTSVGLVTGISLPYLWYDLERNEPTTLEIVPAVAMDRTLLSEMGLSPKEAIEVLQASIKKLRDSRGRFVIILHNETFSSSGEWQGWLEVIEKTMLALQE